jgi:1-acyl-sn-glycerol-3-phosphate acyltransferase
MSSTSGQLGDRSPPISIDRDALARGVRPAMKALIRLGYFSFDVEGLEHVPADGRAVYVQNHAGWFALDAFFLGLAVSEKLGPRRTPFFAAQDAALTMPGLGPALRRIGAVPASLLRHPERLPRELESVGIFPEGVEGNCKPFWQAYRMKAWKRGFVRVAAALEAPVVPVAVFGGEESLPVAWTVRALEPLVGSIFGMPLAPIPLPSRWKVCFLPPVRVARGPDGALPRGDEATLVARRVQEAVQARLDREWSRSPLSRLSAGIRALAGAGRLLAAPRLPTGPA